MSEYAIRMLSVDDKSLTTNLDRAGYRKMGVHVSSSSTFSDAKEVLTQNPVDIIVINFDYHGVDASSMCKHIKEDAKFAHIPVVITSVQSAASVRKKTKGSGVDLIVEQPIPRHLFIEKIKQLLKQQTRTTSRVDMEETRVTLVWNKEKYDLPIGDISNSGMLVSTDMTIPDGALVELLFRLPDYKKEIKVKGEVIRTIKKVSQGSDQLSGVGVKFVKFIGDAERKILRYVSQTSGEDKQMLYYL